MITMSGLDDAEPQLPERALVVSAHPDDVDFGAAGTVARLTAAGCVVSFADTIDLKVDALRAHAGQTAAMDLDPFIRAWARTTATDGGLGEDGLAEAFLTCRTG